MRLGHRVTTGLTFLLWAGLTPGSAWTQTNPVPFVNQPLVPSAVAPGGPDFTLTVNGTGFFSGATVNWNGTPLATTFVSSSQLTATVPAANIVTAGSTLITVSNPAPGGGKSGPTTFEVRIPGASTLVLTAPLPPHGISPVDAAVADFNGDGKADLAFAVNGGSAYIYLGNGDGTFRSPLAFVVGVGGQH